MTSEDAGVPSHGAGDEGVEGGEDPLALRLEKMIIGAERQYTPFQAARAAGVSMDLASRFWRAMGFADIGQAKALTEADVLALRRLAGLVEAASTGLQAWQPTDNRLADWQHLAGHLAALAAVAPPQVVWLPGLREGRGQFWFRVEGSLVRLNPQAPGNPREWVATVAHETFHHLQQELVSAFYRGEPLEGDRAVLAAHYRDARATYETLGPGCPPERHREQDLERGAWVFGTAIARRMPRLS